MRNHRQHERVPLSMKIEYRPDDTGAHFLLESSVNVSEGGIFIGTRTPAEVGTKLEIGFALPGAGKQIVATGVVAWVNPWRDGGPNPNPGMGIRWIRLAAKDRAAITAIVRTVAIIPEMPGVPVAVAV